MFNTHLKRFSNLKLYLSHIYNLSIMSSVYSMGNPTSQKGYRKTDKNRAWAKRSTIHELHDLLLEEKQDEQQYKYDKESKKKKKKEEEEKKYIWWGMFTQQ